jgi:hypothetical protein
MKSYPSIPRSPKGKAIARPLHLFDKLDGSNLRFEWSQREGWFRYGSRHQIIDASHPTLGGGIALFHARLAEPIERIARQHRWEALVAFGELWGDSSLGGRHVDDEPKRLTLFDVAPYKRGFVGPLRFLELFGALDVPKYLGEALWDDALIDRVRRGELAGVTFEGVVGKGGDGHKLVMAKAKTEAWVRRILERYGEDEGRALVES